MISLTVPQTVLLVFVCSMVGAIIGLFIMAIIAGGNDD